MLPHELTSLTFFTLIFRRSFVTSSTIFSRPGWKRALIGCFVVVVVIWLVSCARESIRRDSFEGVLLTGVHHMGPNFKVTQFYMNGHDGSNIGRGSDSGGDICCVLLPKKWRANLAVEVRWEVEDWSHDDKAETKAGVYQSIKLDGTYKAIVPVERYETASHVFVHFYPGGRARVVSSEVGWGNPNHPITDDDLHAGQKATTGARIDDLFSDAELKEMELKLQDRKGWFGSANWH